MAIGPEQKHFSNKFYIGLLLIIISLIVGKLTQVTFFIYFNNDFIRKLSIIVYIISWLPFILGFAWSGKECVTKINRFFTFTYYKTKIKKTNK